jgi:SAM-dependent methyltransferase
MSDNRNADSKSAAYFDELYSHNGDPWRLGSRWYEERKRAITTSTLPQPRYFVGLEIGCSTGELTAALAARCDVILAVDIAVAAVRAASVRTAGLANARVEQRDVTKRLPEGPFDLVVLSEVAYYWDRPTLRRVLAELTTILAEDATVVACHWRHAVADYPLGGDEAHAIIRTDLAMPRLALHDEADFVLEVFGTDPRSVADREGFTE